MKFDIDYVEKLAKVLADNSLTEISLEDGEQAITLRNEVMGVAAAPVAVAAPQAPANVPAPTVAPAAQEAAHLAQPDPWRAPEGSWWPRDEAPARAQADR